MVSTTKSPVNRKIAPIPIVVPTSSGEKDVSMVERNEKASQIRSKFEDIVSVSPHCENVKTDFSDYTDEIDVSGSLCTENSVKFFESIGANQYVLKTLSEGHYSKLSSDIPKYERRNNNSYYEHESFGLKTVFSLIEKGRVEIVKEKPHIVNPLSVAVQRNKNRLILDCSYLNGYVEVPRFKYEDVNDALSYFKKNIFMFTWDLKDGYHQIRIHKDFRKFLGFQFEHEGKIIYCQYLVGPFGLRDLPFLFTKIFRVLVRHWRLSGLYAIKFLDDGICFSDNEEDAEAASIRVRSDLLKAGAYWSVKKSQWNPVQQCEWLGVVWDSLTGSISAAPHRVKKIKETCSLLRSLNSCHVKKLASFSGQINSLSVIVGNCSSLTTRCSQLAVASAPSWDSRVSISENVQVELDFWLNNLDSLNSRCCVVEKPPSCLHVIASDASDTGCGSILDNLETKALRLFSEEERSKHSTYRELVAVSHAIKSFLPKISHSRVKLLVDNQSAARIIDVGSMKSELHSIAMEIFFICLRNGISLAVQWIPRSLNEAADSASREAFMVDTDDWQITQQFFDILDRRWGPLSIDCFANYYNKKINRFYSLFNSQGCEGVDAFSFNWNGENCLLVPPVCIVGKVLRHLQLCRAKGILLVPAWPSAHFWPLLVTEFAPFVQDSLRVRGKNVLCHGLNTNSLLGSPHFVGDMLALRIDCRKEGF